MIYKQIFGTPMGSPLSPIISDLVLQDLETQALKSLQVNVPIFYRYVDDILIAAHRSHFELILNTFNSFHERLTFTLESSVNNTLNFLDTKIILDDYRIIFYLHKKPTFSGRYLNFYSHPVSHKRGIIFGMIDKIILLFHPRFHQKNLIDAVNTLLNNCYPLAFIFDNIRSRIKLHARTKILAIFKDSDKNNNVEPTTKKRIFYCALHQYHL